MGLVVVRVLCALTVSHADVTLDIFADRLKPLRRPLSKKWAHIRK